MKELLKKTMLSACVLFTVCMAFWCVTALPFTGLQYGLVITLTLLLASVLLSALRTLWFTDRLIRRMSYPLRIFCFGITAFTSLAACAYLGSWFPADVPGAWLAFTGIFLVILIAFCVAYQVHFKRTVGSFDAALRSYHERMGR